MAALPALSSWLTLWYSSFQLQLPGVEALSPMLQGLFNLDNVWAAVLAVLPVWAFGALVGLLLPRPKWLGNNSRASALLFTVPSSGFRRLALLYHAAVLVREVWCYTTKPGTFRKILKSLLRLFSKQNTHQLQTSGSTLGEVQVEDNSWFITEKDLANFKYRVEQDDELPGVSSWELMCDKDIPNVMVYKAWRRTLHGGGTEYKSVTIAADATSEEIMDMYLDDDFRPKWDNMIIKHDIVERGDYTKRQLVVHWIRRFPFHFLSDREYLIARQMFREPDALYAVTKGIQNHPDASLNPKLVQMEDFYSMWRSKTVTCPWGSERPASETTLFHYEQFKIPENLARFAVRHGMWGFVKNLGGMLPDYLEKRRSRCQSFAVDDCAYGVLDASKSGEDPTRASNGGQSDRVQRSQAAASVQGGAAVAQLRAVNDKSARRKRRMKGAVTFLVATTLALACQRNMESTRARRRRPGS